MSCLVVSNPCITIDVEDWFQSTWNRELPISSVAGENTLKLLDILDELSIKTTMFIQGKFAEAFPDIVKKIHKHGHEVASHGYSHMEIFTQSREEFKEDIQRSKNILEDLVSEKIMGYRAPDFSVVRKSFWALEVLSELGYEYDSSIFPIKHSRYGIYDFYREPVIIHFGNGINITEYPIATIQIFHKNFPIAGGGYLRLIPGFVFRILSRKVMKEIPFIFYCHPYEFNPSEFRRNNVPIPLKTRLHQGFGRKYFHSRFEKFTRNLHPQRIIDIHRTTTWTAIEFNCLSFPKIT